ncbi:hypothetical protein N7E02_03190 (plasmid) [Aliirhizobium terrae]|nr:hypothetical protein [Rhizobium sp. CC-CFT758]WJH37810.1 hypothetical protein N7E02_03190 [Rhizobium sp. CC-CFT758]
MEKHNFEAKNKAVADETITLRRRGDKYVFVASVLTGPDDWQRGRPY